MLEVFAPSGLRGRGPYSSRPTPIRGLSGVVRRTGAATPLPTGAAEMEMPCRLLPHDTKCMTTGKMMIAKGLASTRHLTPGDRIGNLTCVARPKWGSLCCGRVLLGSSPGFRQRSAHSLQPERMLRRLGHGCGLRPLILNVYLLGSWQTHPTIAPPLPRRPNGVRAPPRFPWKWLSRGSPGCELTGSWEPSWCSWCWA